MNLFNKYYNKFRKHRQNEIKHIVRSEIIINTIKESARCSTNSILNDEQRKEKIIVSLTTHGDRIHSAHLAIESIARQTVKPDVMVLWLAEDKFSDHALPINIKQQQLRGLSVKYCKDTRSYKKFIYTLKEYPDDIIITVDDDCIYPIDMIERLVNAYQKYPNAICCNLARQMTLGSDNRFLKYNEWKYCVGANEPSFNVLPIGVGGVLYFPGCFDAEVFNEKIFNELCPYADDIWFKVMAVKNNVKSCTVISHQDFTNNFISLDSAFINSLGQLNVISGKNDEQLRQLIKYFDIDIEIFK